ncbi:Gfo/Idh/MocA family oxidoreductase [Pseudooceanicola sp. CBS1P-1]|uniref:Gfo/Idh/MocA family oxidoreductase n=1 Tax=Pseudooceanicola albus TaxID=2692189 RepID=A0A6L7G4Q3_9RHOB|nr:MULTISPECIES: Gfo/Idh/MocA family oxidoreductase [Pseudooceanicola]MBT9385210.1 Gfo/Idh/MocA family oxidoreductase [Pseudooceanicola endophyticus]MXN18498.1 gfo/Idh/MocA family oxidoreductase [Pseudooceanicola albus]
MKVGIVGLGARISHVAALFKEAKPDYDFVAFADPTPAGRAYLEGQIGQTLTAYDDLAAMLAAEDLDMLMIGSPNHMHIDHLRAAIEADVPYIFAEKPVVVSEEETFELLELLRDSGGHQRIMIGLVLRYSPLYIMLKEAQAKGQLGQIVSIEASEHIGGYHGAFFMQDWRRYTKYSGGFMLEKCCHDIDLYQGVVGCRPKYISSFGGRKSFTPENRPETMPDYDGIAQRFLPEKANRVNGFKPRWGGGNAIFESDADIIDYQTAIVEYEDGVSMTFHTNMNVPDEFRHFAVMGSRGMAEGDFIRNTFKLTDAFTAETLSENAHVGPSRANHYGADDAMARDIAAWIDDGVPLKVTVLDALEAGLTALAMDRARVSRSVVDMTPLWERFDSYGLRGEA